MYHTLIIGDSNLLHIQRDIYNDNLLQHHDIDVFAKPGFRALFLENHLERALNYTHVIVICGTNDLGKHPRNKNLPARSSEETSQSLINFHNFLWNRNVECYIVGAMNRKDFKTPDEKLRIKQTNNLLKLDLMLNEHSTYVAPRTIQEKHFQDGDEAHLTDEGKFLVRALILRIIEHRYLYYFN